MSAALNHKTLPEFWRHYRRLPKDIQELADKNFELLKANSRHPSLHFKRIGDLWSARVGLHYRALALDDPPDALYGFGLAITTNTTN